MYKSVENCYHNPDVCSCDLCVALMLSQWKLMFLSVIFWVIFGIQFLLLLLGVKVCMLPSAVRTEVWQYGVTFARIIETYLGIKICGGNV